LVRQARLDDRVHFVGEIERERLVEFYRMADLCVMPSSGEGFGITFVEAMASGTAALGLAVAGAQDALVDGELGMTVAESDLAISISKFLASPKPDPKALAERVQARFGNAAFSSNIQNALDRLQIESQPGFSAVT
jgi:phosphatidylinositol alpha-1,6-mannosyltransferase